MCVFLKACNARIVIASILKKEVGIDVLESGMSSKR